MMKKLIIILTSVIFVSFLGFVVWMNLTPGYFRLDRDCRLGYFTNNHFQDGSINLIHCSVGVLGGFILDLAKLDFNKDPEVPSGLRGDFTTTAPKWDYVPSSDRKISGIKGVVIGHYCNGANLVDQPQEYKPCGKEPLSSFVLKIRNSATGAGRQVTTDGEGKFTLELLPGKYTITKPESNRAIIGKDTEVEVRSGLYTKGQLDYTELRP